MKELQAIVRRKLMNSMFSAHPGSRLWVARATHREGVHFLLNDFLKASILSEGGLYVPRSETERNESEVCACARASDKKVMSIDVLSGSVIHDVLSVWSLM